MDERGVWRPGDTLHISFMLEDREKRIPDKHPVALEIYNPRGQFYTKMISTQGTNGFYTFAVPTQADDPTGLWNAYVKVGGTAFHKSLRIETIKPNRLKITLALPTILQASSKDVYAPLTSSWLTGATASRLKAKVEMSLSKVNTQFKNYGQYLFNNPATGLYDRPGGCIQRGTGCGRKSRRQYTASGSNGCSGHAECNAHHPCFRTGRRCKHLLADCSLLSVHIVCGHQSEPAERKVYRNRQRSCVDIVTVNDQGQPVNRSNLEYKIYRISWSWWWENGEESFGTYINNSSITPVASGNLQTTGGKTSFKFRINYPDWGRYLVYVKDRESGHATGGTVYIDWPDWRGRSNKTDPSGIKMLAFSLDKRFL